MGSNSQQRIMTSDIASHVSIDRYKWQSYADNHECGTIFHTPYMYDVYYATPNHEPFALFVLDDKGDIQAMLSGYIQVVKPGLFSGISKRAVLMQSPIYSKSDALKKLLSHYKRVMGHRVVYTEIRNHSDTQHVKNLYYGEGFRFEEHLNILVDLSQSEEDLWKQIHSKRRNEIRKAIKLGVSVSLLNSDSLHEAYTILQGVYNRARLPLLSYSFFKHAFDISTKDSGMVAYGAYYGGILIGTMIVLQYKQTIYDLYAGSLSDNYDKNPNDILPWEVFKYSKKKGFKRFDFGGAGKPSVPYGVRDYKLKFGGDLVNYGRYNLVHSPVKYIVAEKGFRVIKKLTSIT